MRLVSFSIQNYRSITRAKRILAGSWTVLIGPNNEGKSNIVKGLATVLDALSRQQRFVSGRGNRMILRADTYSSPELRYDWTRDFPVNLQESHPEGHSVFNLEFELTDEEVRDFRTGVGSRLNGTLPIRVEFGPRTFGFQVTKQGPGSRTLSRKAPEIATFIATRLNFEYIPAVRTANSARRIVEGMVDRALTKIEDDPRYRDALRAVGEIQQPVLDEISDTIRATLGEFMPEVTDVSVSISSEARYSAMRRSCEIVVDDGTATDLKYKGDGVQSIAALSLMRYASESGALGRNLILAIEEPESHLHPNAIHRLRGVLRDIALDRQLIMTTHNPLFVDRMQVPNNIIVSANKAEPASSIRQIRDVLGVRASDNLRNADLVVVTEGEGDVAVLRGFLSRESEGLAQLIDQGAVTFESLAGAANLSYKLSQLRDALCMAHAVIDDDAAGRSSVQRALDEGLLDLTDVTMTTSPDKRDSEIEDLYDVSAYRGAVMAQFGVDLAGRRFHSARKWSDRVGSVFRGAGKPWDDGIRAQVKLAVANAVVGSEQPFDLHRREPMEALVAAIEEKLGRLAAAA